MLSQVDQYFLSYSLLFVANSTSDDVARLDGWKELYRMTIMVIAKEDGERVAKKKRLGYYYINYLGIEYEG